MTKSYDVPTVMSRERDGDDLFVYLDDGTVIVVAIPPVDGDYDGAGPCHYHGQKGKLT